MAATLRQPALIALLSVLACIVAASANPTVATWPFRVPPSAEDVSMKASMNDSDTVLVVFGNDSAEAQVSRDGRIGSFWYSLPLSDSIVLSPSRTCPSGNCGFSGDRDARVVVRAAATQYRLCLLVTVTDDAWMTSTDTNLSRTTDCLTLYIDGMPSQTVLDRGDWRLGASSLTYESSVFEFSAGTPQPCDRVRYSYYNNATWTWVKTDPMGFDALASLYGVQCEWVQLDSHTRAMELALPWSFFSNSPALQLGQYLGGQRLAFTAVYHDRDNVGDSCATLSWRVGDPSWLDSAAVNHWGDICIDAVNPGFPAPWPPLLRLAGNDTTTNRHPTIEWDTVSGATGYHLVGYTYTQPSWFSHTFVDTVLPAGQTGFTPHDTVPLGELRWRIASLPNSGYLLAPPLRVLVQRLYQPWPVLPLGGAAVSAFDSLIFTTVADYGDSVRYILEIANSPAFDTGTVVRDTLAGPPAPLAPYVAAMVPGESYHWGVQALNRWGDTSGLETTSLFVYSASRVARAPQPRQTGPLQLRYSGRSGRVTIACAAKSNDRLLLDIYDIHGALVRTLCRDIVAPGRTVFTWDRRDAQGRQMGAGRYLVVMRSGQEQHVLPFSLSR